jgi:hypothetical protein
MYPIRDIRSIKGLSERVHLPRLGKIRLGIRQPGSNGASAPTEVPHFVCPSRVQRVYGAAPTALRILFPVEDARELFPQAYKWYGGPTLKCKGDGQVGVRRWTDVEPVLQGTIGGTHEPNDLVDVPCPCPRLPSGDCTLKAHLMYLLPDISLAGVWQTDTQSVHNIREINSALRFYRELLGRIALVPFTLHREPTKVRWQGKLVTHHLLKLTYDGDLAAAQAIRATAPTVMGPVTPLPFDTSPGNGSSMAPSAPAPAQPKTDAAPQQPNPPPVAIAPTPADAPHEVLAPSATTPALPPGIPTAPPASTAATSPSAGSEAALTPSMAPPPPTPASGSAGSPRCACSVRVTARIAEYSRRRFGQILCITCQKRQAGASKGATP